MVSLIDPNMVSEDEFFEAASAVASANSTAMETPMFTRQ